MGRKKDEQYRTIETNIVTLQRKLKTREKQFERLRKKTHGDLATSTPRIEAEVDAAKLRLTLRRKR